VIHHVIHHVTSVRTMFLCTNFFQLLRTASDRVDVVVVFVVEVVVVVVVVVVVAVVVVVVAVVVAVVVVVVVEVVEVVVVVVVVAVVAGCTRSVTSFRPLQRISSFFLLFHFYRQT
jgi:hypothetical protein